MSKSHEAMTHLQEVIFTLVAPEGCEWDRAQTPESLCEYLLEESYELVDAIRSGSSHDAMEELGDVFFLLFFISHLYSTKEDGFPLKEVFDMASAKMIRRHPHVFAGQKFDSFEQQLAAWEEIKRKEKTAKGERPKGVFDSLPTGLPALAKAYRINSKAARVDFTWDSDDDVVEQFEAELLEFLDALEFGNQSTQRHEFGDLLFTLVELGRRKGIKANEALDSANNRFLQRFSYMENAARRQQKDFTGLSMDEKNALWDEAKATLKEETE